MERLCFLLNPLCFQQEQLQLGYPLGDVVHLSKTERKQMYPKHIEVKTHYVQCPLNWLQKDLELNHKQKLKKKINKQKIFPEK